MPPLPAAFRPLIDTMPWLYGACSRAMFRHRLRRVANQPDTLPAFAIAKPHPETFLYSRYGSETVGNHFIQLGLLRACFHSCAQRRVTLLSSAPERTARGLAEMRELLEQAGTDEPLRRFVAEKVRVDREERIEELGRGDLLILGGGPIMDDLGMVRWQRWFEWADRAGARILIAGCGLGPLRYEETARLAERLLERAHAVVLRNRPQQRYCRAAQSPPLLAPDPAFLCAPLLAPLAQRKKKPILAINARPIDLQCHPQRRMSSEEVAERLAQLILPMRRWSRVEQVLPFSTQEGTTADSPVAIAAAEKVAQCWGVELLPLPPATPKGLAEALSQAGAVVSTRMHGWIVALLLGRRAAGIDYIAEGGKSAQLYGEWAGRAASPSLYRAGSLRCEDFIALSDALGRDCDGLLHTYVCAMRQALG